MENSTKKVKKGESYLDVLHSSRKYISPSAKARIKKVINDHVYNDEHKKSIIKVILSSLPS